MKTFNWKLLAVVITAWLMIVLILAVCFLRESYRSEKKRADEVQALAEQRQTIISDLRQRQNDVAAMDAKYTKELADAQSTIDQLQHDVAAGRRRLQLNAKCPKPAAASLDDATSARLSDAAERDYFTLRSRIETAKKQIAGLQEYVREQCLQ